MRALAPAVALVVASPAAAEAGDTYVSLRLGIVAADATTDGIPFFGPEGLTPPGTFPDSEIGLGNSPSATFIIGHKLTDHLAADVLIGSPSFLEVRTKGIEQFGVRKAADIVAAVPAVYLTWFPAEPASRWQPSLSGGVGTLFYMRERASDQLQAALGEGTKTRFKNDAVLLSARAGLDYKLSDRWSIGAHACYFDIDTAVRVLPTGSVAVAPGVSLPIAPINIPVAVDAYGFTAAITYRF